MKGMGVLRVGVSGGVKLSVYLMVEPSVAKLCELLSGIN